MLAFDVDATLADRPDAILIARHAILADHAVAWPAGVTPEQRAAAIAQLKALGILVRTGV